VPSGYAAGYRVGVGFGPAGNVEPAKDILRLHPMGPEGKTPLAIFVGMLADGKTAMFLLDAKADATGDGRCWPTKVTCQLLELHKGDAEFFDVPTGQSGVVQYELDVNTIVKRYTATSIGSYHVRKRESPSGRKAMNAVIRSGHTYVTRLMYSRQKGVLFMPRRTGKTGGPSA